MSLTVKQCIQNIKEQKITEDEKTSCMTTFYEAGKRGQAIDRTKVNADIQKELDAAKQYASSAAASANDAKISEKQAAQSADAAKINEGNSKTSADAAAASAGAAAENANEAEASAGAAKISKNEAAGVSLDMLGAYLEGKEDSEMGQEEKGSGEENQSILINGLPLPAPSNEDAPEDCGDQINTGLQYCILSVTDEGWKAYKCPNGYMPSYNLQETQIVQIACISESLNCHLIDDQEGHSFHTSYVGAVGVCLYEEITKSSLDFQ